MKFNLTSHFLRLLNFAFSSALVAGCTSVGETKHKMAQAFSQKEVADGETNVAHYAVSQSFQFASKSFNDLGLLVVRYEITTRTRWHQAAAGSHSEKVNY